MLDSSGSVEYIYAKTSGMLAKAFVGKRANRLFQAKNLADLWQTVFESPAPAVPENVLAQTIEKNAENRFLSEYISLVDSFTDRSLWHSSCSVLLIIQKIKRLILHCAPAKNI